MKIIREITKGTPIDLKKVKPLKPLTDPFNDRTIKYSIEEFVILGDPGYEIIVFIYGKKWYMASVRGDKYQTIEKAIEKDLTINFIAAQKIISNAKIKWQR